MHGVFSQNRIRDVIVDVPPVAYFSHEQYLRICVSLPIDDSPIVADSKSVIRRVTQAFEVVIGLPDDVVELRDDSFGDFCHEGF